MTFKRLGLLLAGAGAALVMVACGENDTPDGGTGACTATSCATDETCHPTAKVCVKTCTGAVDCPSTAKTCAPQGGGAMDGGAAYCQCATDQLCNSGGSTDLVCSNLDKICVAKCASNSDCGSGRTCNTTTGQCAAAGVDAGSVCTPACVAPKVCGNGTCVDPCFPGYCTTATDTCNLTSGLCEAPKACTSTNQEPDVCAYGQYCTTANSCTDVPPTTCANFTPGTGKTPVWDPTQDTGPIIYWVEPLPGDENASGGTNFCTGAGEKSFTGRIHAYNPTSLFPASGGGAQLSGLFYVTTTGNTIDMVAGNLFRKVGGFQASTDRKTATIKFTLCSTTAAAGSTIPAGFYFTGGNEYCASLPD